MPRATAPSFWPRLPVLHRAAASREERNADQFLLPVLVLFIGLGSLAFHLYANSAAALADVVPIGVFMLAYLGLALNRFLRRPPADDRVLVIGFTAIVAIVLQVRCGQDFGSAFPRPSARRQAVPQRQPWLFAGAGGADRRSASLLSRARAQSRALAVWAAAIFAVSITLRSLDLRSATRS